MPGVLPTMRRRRLAPVPCLARSKATNFMCILQTWEPTATSRAPISKWACGCRPGESSEQVDLVREQTHHRLALGDALDRLCDQRRHGELADLAAAAGGVGQGNRVRHHHFVEG